MFLGLFFSDFAFCPGERRAIVGGFLARFAKIKRGAQSGPRRGLDSLIGAYYVAPVGGKAKGVCRKARRNGEAGRRPTAQRSERLGRRRILTGEETNV